MRWSVLIVLFASTMTLAQEGALHADLRREGERVSEACNSFSLKVVPVCGYELFTDHPLHIAAGSLPPQNGFGLGGAFVWSKNTKDWRLSADLDAVGATSGAWRAGAYLKLVHTPKAAIHVTVSQPGQKSKKAEPPFVHPYTVFNLYVQSVSLDHLNFFGLGNSPTLGGETVFGMTQTVIGGSVIKPVFEGAAIRKLNLALLGEVNGRLLSVRQQHGDSVPTIGALYTNVTAPGLGSQPGFLQLSEGFRIKPVIADLLELNYSANFQQFFAVSNSDNSFRRWTADLNHTFYLYGYTKSKPSNTDTIGPDSCAPGGENCPKVSLSRNLNGSVNVRLMVSESIASGTSRVPFYFQQTLGGSDINSAMTLASYRDYRFRAPNLLLLQQSFEHSIWGPFGINLVADQGRVALTRGDLGFSHLKHTFAGGLTLRAGAFPMVSLMFAWGGPEGHHNILNMNTSLLGGSPRLLLD